jgi:hypothetical protein
MNSQNDKQLDYELKKLPPVNVKSADANPDEKKVPFWSVNPNILFQHDYMLEFFPVETMTYEQKLNAISRAVIVLGVVGFIFTRSIRILVVSIITLAAIYMLYSFHDSKKKQSEKTDDAEGFANQADDVLKQFNYTKNPEVFDKPTSENPFSNVLIPDYEYNPDKKPAPPAFNGTVNDNILVQAKKLVSELNPGQPDISDKLFKDLGEQYVFEQSLRQFNSNPATTIPNDQKGFAEFCYGSMVSSRDGNPFALARNLPRYNNY